MASPSTRFAREQRPCWSADALSALLYSWIATHAFSNYVHDRTDECAECRDNQPDIKQRALYLMFNAGAYAVDFWLPTIWNERCDHDIFLSVVAEETQQARSGSPTSNKETQRCRSE
ncbi:hypothetical protein AFERRI_600009 [Acidithiobacillus ferrivorans]|uniref:Uncharacterized protein n=1 Tax=Acidithiobacillus ferrivorans TaxID=160808 RepID=A0A060UYI7_9PROT|nr:hypothetical protein AFERRI_600009 [Acidithiobacillus ferrivorans]